MNVSCANKYVKKSFYNIYIYNFSAYTKYITEECLIYVAGVKLRKGLKKINVMINTLYDKHCECRVHCITGYAGLQLATGGR